MADHTLKRSDYGSILLYCLTLYVLVLTVGGPLTMHEGVLSQTSRHMLADHDWVIPHFGAGPWLERPPLPQWITVAIASLIGHCDEEWIVRIGPALSGTATVLLTAWLAAALFGRAVGVLSALVLATMYQFVRYSTLAEADMFLAPIVAGCLCLFAYLEVVRPHPADEGCHFVGKRPWTVAAFFVLLGMTNLAKGLVFGTAMVLIPIGGYLLWNRDLRPILRYVWLWGWLLFLVVALTWPLLAYRRYPDVLELWHFDLFARLHGSYMEEPRWYYLAHWFWVVLPWPLAGLTGIYLATRPALAQRSLPHRLLLCWALLTPLVFSYSRGKHHHYMIHFLAAWAILSSAALIWAWQKAQTWPGWLRQPVAVPVVLGLLGDVAIACVPGLPGPSWLLPLLLVAWPATLALFWFTSFHRSGQFAMTASFLLVLVLYWLGFAYKGQYLHRSNEDTAFVRAAREMVPDGQSLLVHPCDEALEGLRILFYCPEQTCLLLNPTFLRDDCLTPDVYVIAKSSELPKLRRYGQTSIVLQSEKSRRERTPGDRWALFHVKLREDLAHHSARVRISPMQAMYREPGPDLK